MLLVILCNIPRNIGIQIFYSQLSLCICFLLVFLLLCPYILWCEVDSPSYGLQGGLSMFRQLLASRGRVWVRQAYAGNSDSIHTALHCILKAVSPGKMSQSSSWITSTWVRNPSLSSLTPHSSICILSLWSLPPSASRKHDLDLKYLIRPEISHIKLT